MVARVSQMMWLVLLVGCGSPAEPALDVATAEVSREPEAPPTVEIDPARVQHGIDVSVHSGAISWSKVKQLGKTFAFVKATEGVDLNDGSFAEHWPALKEQGLYRGAYHFYVTEDDPELQAQFFIDAVRLEPGDLVPVVDVELLGHGTTVDGMRERLQTFLTRLEAHYGVKPMIYTGPNFWDEFYGEGFGDYPLWVAEYGVDQPRIPQGWDTWHLWQWQGDVKLDGVEKGADLTRVNSGKVDLARLFVHARVASAAAPSTPEAAAPSAPVQK